MRTDSFLQKVIAVCFSLLFFLTPLFFTPFNSELFEFNKIILVYGFTVIITGAWVGRMIVQKKFLWRKTFFDIPLILFLASQIVSTVFSIDPHTSLFGYYSRFNGGLLSTVSYLLLYWTLVNNCEKKDVLKFIKVSLISAFIVSIYGILEHFGHSFSCLLFGQGFGVSCWVQDVQNRVFATLGQPNWLGAYIAILLPLTWWLILNKLSLLQEKKIASSLYAPRNDKNLIVAIGLSIIFYLCLLFTQSRSGFLGFLLSFAAFWATTFFFTKENRKLVLKPFLFLIFALCALIFVFGSPFSQLNQYFSFQSLKSHLFTLRSLGAGGPTSNPPPSTSGGTESGEIRKIVWQGAIDVFKKYPLFGSGVETFAYSYYGSRPMAHNLISEWDFLYNKAHNEYLNYLATTGVFGLGSYLLLIASFTFWTIVQLKNVIARIRQLAETKQSRSSLRDCFGDKPLAMTELIFALFSGWITLLVTNFFGFSVVITSLYFFLIPAFVIILSADSENPASYLPLHTSRSLLPLLLPLFAVSCSLLAVLNLWRSDYFYNLGDKQIKSGENLTAFQNLQKAVKIFPTEPVFLNSFSTAAANLSLVAYLQKEATTSAQLAQLAESYSDIALSIGPKNINFYKTRATVFYTLAAIDPSYYQQAIQTLNQAMLLAPTHPKFPYILGLIYTKTKEEKLAIANFQKAIEMKPNYEEARNGLALYYESLGKKKEAIWQLQEILKFKPDDQSVKGRIEKLKQ